MKLTQETIIKYVSVLIALLTFAGIAVHETKVDTLTKFAIALPVVVASYEGAHLLHLMGGEAHTHVEKISIEKTASRLSSSFPKLHKREREFYHHKIQNVLPKGHHEFDNYNLPIVA